MDKALLSVSTGVITGFHVFKILSLPQSQSSQPVSLQGRKTGFPQTLEEHLEVKRNPALVCLRQAFYEKNDIMHQNKRQHEREGKKCLKSQWFEKICIFRARNLILKVQSNH